MAVVFRLRGPDGKYIKGDTGNISSAMTKFASNVIKGGRAILNKPGLSGSNKRTRSDTLFSNYYYTKKSTKSTITLGFEFGGAEDYWMFVDQGVRGVGYGDESEAAKDRRKDKGITKRGATGIARGANSPFSFKYAKPSLSMVESIKRWIGNKPVSLTESSIDSAAWGIGYGIKRRGLERTLFYTKPVTKALKTLPDELLEAFKLDFSKLVDKLPGNITIQTKE